MIHFSILLPVTVVDGGFMKKMCARCGTIFEAGDAAKKFCSERCEKVFRESSLGYIKKGQTQRKVYAPEM